MSASISSGPSTITPDLVLGLSDTHESRNVIHRIIGRPDPDVTLQPAELRTGTLKLFFMTESDADAAVALHRQAGVFVLSIPERPSFDGFSYVLDGRIQRELDDVTLRRWTVEVQYREVQP